ncbi:FAD-binding oxidoreductase [Phycicoccus avicenniae]|uniref:FAD-binding oxidoreductase n=1 Tax=Phycicoccus avicenniae TaxID=2828860 RepID=UPI0020128A02|nr:FAD-binding oxidoreductase [Phycicoccus avicenniae]
MTAATTGLAAHDRGVQRLVDSHRAIPAGAPVRLAKRTSNLFRARTATDTPGLDTSGLTGVVSIDTGARTADVQGMCTYEDLVAATLPHGLTPLVVPQLRTITLGGAVTGLGIESASWRNGLPHESVLEMDVLTGAGEVVTTDATDRHPDLFHAFPNSYGTLGYATRLRIELEPVGRTVSLRHVRFHDVADLVAAIGAVTSAGAWDGEPVDYVDGVVFSAQEAYLVLGLRTEDPGPTSDYTGREVYYRSLRHDGPRPRRDVLTTHDYLWRWDTDWFWCSRAFGAQHPAVRRLWPRRYLRSSVYWRLVALDRRFDVADRLEARRGRPARERVVQDVEIPLERTADFLRWFLREVPIEPVWLCPLRLRDDRTWTLYPLAPGETYVNVGFWSTVPVTPGEPGATNRRIEDVVTAHGGHKSLYSEAFYDEDTFWRHYGGADYPALKERHDPDHRLPDLYAKAVRGA